MTFTYVSCWQHVLLDEHGGCSRFQLNVKHRPPIKVLCTMLLIRVAESESQGVGDFWVESDSDSQQH